MAFDHKIPDVPKYAPFVAAGFFFGPASFLKEVGVTQFVAHFCFVLSCACVFCISRDSSCIDCRTFDPVRSFTSNILIFFSGAF